MALPFKLGTLVHQASCGAESRKESHDTMRWSKLIMFAFFFSGIAVLGAMIWQVGLTDLTESFAAMGVWLLPYFLLKTVPIVLHTTAWTSCFPDPKRPLRFWRLILISRAGGAVNNVTPTVTIGGEMVKVLLLEPSIPRKQAIAAVVIDKASTTLAKMLYLFLGLLYLAQHLPLPGQLQLSLSISIGLILLGLIGFVAFQRYGLLSKLMQVVKRLNVMQERLQKLSEHIIALDAELMAYYTRYPWRFVGSLLLHGLAYAFEAIKTYILLRLLLGVDAPTFTEAIMVAVAVAALDEIFFFVPGRLGTLEGARILVLSALGAAQIYALAFGLIARVEHLVWMGFGFVAYALCTRFPPLTPTRRQAEVSST
jgi:uncharacterized protein (TIRG00374 family)